MSLTAQDTLHGTHHTIRTAMRSPHITYCRVHNAHHTAPANQCKLHCAHCKLNIVQCLGGEGACELGKTGHEKTLYVPIECTNIQSAAQRTLHCTANRTHCTVLTAQDALHSTHRTGRTAMHSPHISYCRVNTAQHSTQCKLHSAHCKHTTHTAQLITHCTCKRAKHDTYYQIF